MGLVEAVLEHVSIKSAAFLILFALAVRLLLARVDEHRRIKRLGNHGPAVKTYAPLGELLFRPPPLFSLCQYSSYTLSLPLLLSAQMS